MPTDKLNVSKMIGWAVVEPAPYTKKIQKHIPRSRNQAGHAPGHSTCTQHSLGSHSAPPPSAHSWHRAASQTRRPEIPQTPTRAPTRPQLPPGVKQTPTRVIYGGNSCTVHIFTRRGRSWVPHARIDRHGGAGVGAGGPSSLCFPTEIRDSENR